jgi:subtilisin family serine protease
MQRLRPVTPRFDFMIRVSAHRLSLLLLALLVQLSLAAGAVSAVDPSAPADNSPRDYIVVFKDWVNVDDETFGLERAFGFASKFRYTAALKGFAARLTPGIANALTRLPFIHTVSPDGVAHAVEAIAGGDSVPSGVARMGGATSTVAHGAAGVAVAVIDTGVDLSHPDLNVTSGTNCITPGASANDDHGHGTHVAGTIGARNNGSGVIGVAPGTKVYAVKVLNSQGSGAWSQVICGIDWVTANSAPLNIKVVNMSLGGGGSNTANCGNSFFAPDPMHQAICRSTQAGVTFVVAAGNDGVNLSGFAPAAFPETLAVTAVADSDGVGGATGGSPSCWSGHADDRFASFSNYATSSTHINHTIAAPGMCIFSTARGGGYATMSGTSMASPHAAGAVALCLTGGACVGQTPAQIIQTMRNTAAAKRSATASYGFYGDPSNPYSTRYYGNMVWSGADLGTGTPPPAADFSLSPSPSTRSTTQGSGATYLLTVNPVNGFSSSVGLSVSGLPSGATATFSPQSTTSTSTLTIQTAADTPTGTFGLTVSGTGGGLTHTTGISLTVTATTPPPVPGDFSMSASPATYNVQNGNARTYTVTISPTGGFTSAVALSATGVPPSSTVTFTPASTTSSSSMKIKTATHTPLGLYTITITGTGGGKTHTASVTLRVR